MKFNTRAIHGHPNDPQTGAVSFPIYQTATYSQEFPGQPRVYQGKVLSYARTENPTRTALENSVALLEGARYASAFGSGLAAISTALQLLKHGDHVLAIRDIYGGAYRMFTKVFANFGITFDFVDTHDLAAVERAIRPNTRLLWLESPSNPQLKITDIAAACRLARSRFVLTLVDNTFATPYLQNPLELGADLVLHSATKYIAGHTDVLNGLLLTNDPELGERIRFLQNAVGAIPGPQDCFLVLRGLKTLGVRMERHCANALRVAQHLESHPAVERVFHPGLESHPGHAIAARQMRAGGAIVSFELKGDVEATQRTLTRFQLFTLAESLGGVKSLICHPPTMTHASVEADVRRRAGIPDGLVRASVGLEDVEDLLEDLDQALGQA